MSVLEITRTAQYDLHSVWIWFKFATCVIFLALSIDSTDGAQTGAHYKSGLKSGSNVCNLRGTQPLKGGPLPSRVYCPPALCSYKCERGGHCVAPGRCLCKDGVIRENCRLSVTRSDGRVRGAGIFQGQCSLRGVCHHHCVTLTNKSFKCGCRPGYQLLANHRACKRDYAKASSHKLSAAPTYPKSFTAVQKKHPRQRHGFDFYRFHYQRKHGAFRRQFQNLRSPKPSQFETKPRASETKRVSSFSKHGKSSQGSSFWTQRGGSESGHGPPSSKSEFRKLHGLGLSLYNFGHRHMASRKMAESLKTPRMRPDRKRAFREETIKKDVLPAFSKHGKEEFRKRMTFPSTIDKTVHGTRSSARIPDTFQNNKQTDHELGRLSTSNLPVTQNNTKSLVHDGKSKDKTLKKQKIFEKHTEDLRKSSETKQNLPQSNPLHHRHNESIAVKNTPVPLKQAQKLPLILQQRHKGKKDNTETTDLPSQSRKIAGQDTNHKRLGVRDYLRRARKFSSLYEQKLRDYRRKIAGKTQSVPAKNYKTDQMMNSKDLLLPWKKNKNGFKQKISGKKTPLKVDFLPKSNKTFEQKQTVQDSGEPVGVNAQKVHGNGNKYTDSKSSDSPELARDAYSELHVQKRKEFDKKLTTDSMGDVSGRRAKQDQKNRNAEAGKKSEDGLNEAKPFTPVHTTENKNLGVAEKQKKDEVNKMKKDEGNKMKKDEGNKMKKDEVNKIKLDEMNKMKKDEVNRMKKDEGNKMKKDEVNRMKKDEVNRMKKDEVNKMKLDEVNRMKKDEVNRMKKDEVNRMKKDEVNRMKKDEVNRMKKDEVNRMKKDEVNKMKLDEVNRMKKDEVNRMKKDEVNRMKKDEVNKMKLDEVNRMKKDEGNKMKKYESNSMKKDEENRVKKDEANRMKELRSFADKKTSVVSLEKVDEMWKRKDGYSGQKHIENVHKRQNIFKGNKTDTSTSHYIQKEKVHLTNKQKTMSKFIKTVNVPKTIQDSAYLKKESGSKDFSKVTEGKQITKTSATADQRHIFKNKQVANHKRYDGYVKKEPNSHSRKERLHKVQGAYNGKRDQMKDDRDPLTTSKITDYGIQADQSDLPKKRYSSNKHAEERVFGKGENIAIKMKKNNVQKPAGPLGGQIDYKPETGNSGHMTGGVTSKSDVPASPPVPSNVQSTVQGKTRLKVAKDRAQDQNKLHLRAKMLSSMREQYMDPRMAALIQAMRSKRKQSKDTTKKSKVFPTTTQKPSEKTNFANDKTNASFHETKEKTSQTSKSPDDKVKLPIKDLTMAGALSKKPVKEIPTGEKDKSVSELDTSGVRTSSLTVENKAFLKQSPNDKVSDKQEALEFGDINLASKTSTDNPPSIMSNEASVRQDKKPIPGSQTAKDTEQKSVPDKKSHTTNTEHEAEKVTGNSQFSSKKQTENVKYVDISPGKGIKMTDKNIGKQISINDYPVKGKLWPNKPDGQKSLPQPNGSPNNEHLSGKTFKVIGNEQETEYLKALLDSEEIKSDPKLLSLLSDINQEKGQEEIEKAKTAENIKSDTKTKPNGNMQVALQQFGTEIISDSDLELENSDPELGNFPSKKDTNSHLTQTAVKDKLNSFYDESAKEPDSKSKTYDKEKVIHKYGTENKDRKTEVRVLDMKVIHGAFKLPGRKKHKTEDLTSNSHDKSVSNPETKFKTNVEGRAGKELAHEKYDLQESSSQLALPRNRNDLSSEEGKPTPILGDKSASVGKAPPSAKEPVHLKNPLDKSQKVQYTFLDESFNKQVLATPAHKKISGTQDLKTSEDTESSSLILEDEVAQTTEGVGVRSEIPQKPETDTTRTRSGKSPAGCRDDQCMTTEDPDLMTTTEQPVFNQGRRVIKLEEIRCPPGYRRALRHQYIVCEPLRGSAGEEGYKDQLCLPGEDLVALPGGKAECVTSGTGPRSCGEGERLVEEDGRRRCETIPSRNLCPRGQEFISLGEGQGYECRYPVEEEVTTTTPTIALTTPAPACPDEQHLINTPLGPVCLPSNFATPLPGKDDLCPSGMTPHMTSIGVICQFKAESVKQKATTTVRPKQTTTDPNKQPCRPGQILIDTPEGPRCGFTPDHVTSGKPLRCGQDEMQIFTASGSVCKRYDQITPEENPCPMGQKVQKRDGGVLCTYIDDVKKTGVPGNSQCAENQLLVQTSAGFLCQFVDTSSDELPVCQAKMVLVKTEKGFECITRAESKLVCSEGFEMVRTSAGFFCSRRGGLGDLSGRCRVGEILLMVGKVAFCRRLEENADLCGPGFKPRQNRVDGSYICAPIQTPLLECPDGFYPSESQSRPECLPMKPHRDLCDDPGFIEMFGNQVDCEDHDLSAILVPCQEGYELEDVVQEGNNGPMCKLVDYVEVICESENASDHNVTSCQTQNVRSCDKDVTSGLGCKALLQMALTGCQPQCANGGTCEGDKCVCPPGLTGVACEEDIDECKNLPLGFCENECLNTFGSFTCSCPFGSTLNADGKTCKVIDCIPDCLNGGACDLGVCKCPQGLTGQFCQHDVDECLEGKHHCQEICRNTFGGYGCVCPPGSRLAEDGRNCINTTCNPECRNGGQCLNHKCVCPPGFHGIVCQLDVNECRDQSHNCSHDCINTNGGYKCQCSKGLYLLEDGRTCFPYVP